MPGLKDKKSSHDDMKKNLHFKQSRLNFINNQNLVVSIVVDVVAKTGDEVYILSIIKIYCYFSFVSSTEPKKVELLKISEVIQLL